MILNILYTRHFSFLLEDFEFILMYDREKQEY